MLQGTTSLRRAAECGSGDGGRRLPWDEVNSAIGNSAIGCKLAARKALAEPVAPGGDGRRLDSLADSNPAFGGKLAARKASAKVSGTRRSRYAEPIQLFTERIAAEDADSFVVPQLQEMSVFTDDVSRLAFECGRHDGVVVRIGNDRSCR